MKQSGRLAELLARGVAVALALAIFVALLVFSIVVFAVAVTVAVLLFGYLWWKTRRLRVHGRVPTEPPADASGGGDRTGKQRLEVEVIHVKERKETS